MKAKMWNFSKWTKSNKNTITILDNILKKSGFTVLKFIDYKFSPYGYTALWLLGESHLAIHTFPEEEKTYIEITSCIEGKYNKFLVLFREWQNEN